MRIAKTPERRVGEVLGTGEGPAGRGAQDTAVEVPAASNDAAAPAAAADRLQRPLRGRETP